MSKIILFEFAGRRANMEMQRPFVEALLDLNQSAELHLWDLTRDPEDAQYIWDWASSDTRIKVMDHLHPGHPLPCRYPTGAPMRRRGFPPCYCLRCKPPYEAVWEHYALSGRYTGADESDTTFVKFDDDVIWMDLDNFSEVLDFLKMYPGEVASANVVNNAVCAKYEPSLARHVMEEFGIGSTDEKWDSDWWHLHTRAEFANLSHAWFVANLPPNRNDAGLGLREWVRTREGEKVSINFVAMKAPVLRKAAALMTDSKMGDEGAVDLLLPWIIPNFRVAHLSFGPQDKHLTEQDRTDIRNLYRKAGQS